MEKMIKSMPNNKAPGIDLVTHFWYKKLSSMWKELLRIFKSYCSQTMTIPAWLPLSRTTLIPKNADTQNPKNYRPIACENNVFKIYTGILAGFINDHCHSNNIIFEEQAANKRESWGCIDQLLINKTIMDEAVKYKRSIFCIWLDYKKAYDSVPHSWILESLKLAKIPPWIIQAVMNIMDLWKARVHLNTKNGDITLNDINYLVGMMQGDHLSVVMFLLSFNPLSYLLRKSEGYMIGKPGNRDQKITSVIC